MLSAIWGVLTSKLAGPGFAAGALVLALLLTVSRLDASAQRREVTRLNDSITAPVTGWAARLEVCKVDRGNLQAAVTDQTGKVNAWKGKADAAMAQADELAAQAQKSKAKVDAAAARLAAYKPAPAANACQDLLAADALALDVLKELRP